MPKRTPRNYHDHRWVALAHQIRVRENHRCEVCGDEDCRNQVHHDYYKLYGELWDIEQDFLHLLCDFDHRRTEEEYQELRRCLGGRAGANWMDIQAFVKAVDQARWAGHSVRNILEHCRVALTADPEYLRAMDIEIKKFLIRRGTLKKAA